MGEDNTLDVVVFSEIGGIVAVLDAACLDVVGEPGLDDVDGACLDDIGGTGVEDVGVPGLDFVGADGLVLLVVAGAGADVVDVVGVGVDVFVGGGAAGFLDLDINGCQALLAVLLLLPEDCLLPINSSPSLYLKAIRLGINL